MAVDERAAFETDTLDLYPVATFGRFASGRYNIDWIENQWGGWQRRAKFASPQPSAAPVAAAVQGDAAPAWDADATNRLRSIVDLLGLQSRVPEGDLIGYEFSVLGFVRREIECLQAAQRAASQPDSERDAARYRWVRDNSKRKFDIAFNTPSNDPADVGETYRHTSTWDGPDNAIFDAMVDAAMAAQPHKKD